LFQLLHPLPWVDSETRRGNGTGSYRGSACKDPAKSPDLISADYFGRHYREQIREHNSRPSLSPAMKSKVLTSDAEIILYASPSAATPRGLPKPHAGNISPKSHRGADMQVWPITRTWHRLTVPWRVGDLGLASFHLAETMEIIDRGPLLGDELGGMALLTFRSEQGRKPSLRYIYSRRPPAKFLLHHLTTRRLQQLPLSGFL
jgi:hypothetical protein